VNSQPSQAAIILAGGRSTRLGRDKASEPLLGRPLLQWVVDRVQPLIAEIVIVRAAGQQLPPLEATMDPAVVEDLFPGRGPLGGLFTGLQTMRAGSALAVACDMPLLQTPLLAQLLRLALQHEAVVPVQHGLPQPLCAAYSKACLPPARQQLVTGELKLASFLDKVATHYVASDVWSKLDPEGLSFLNINTDEDLDRASRVMEAMHPE
jgi:molybdopterin-guanine dinucleotide biosynthesis protein A